MKKTLITLSAAVTAFLAFTLDAQAAYTDDCITFSSSSSFALKTNNGAKNWDGTLWTSTDKTNWTEWAGAEVPAAKTGGAYHLYVRGNTDNTKITGGYQWVLTGSAGIACSGNIETLRGAMGNNPSSAPMESCCYSSMFSGCTALTAAPALPATTLADECYAGMFYGCTALTTAPALPATTLAKYCYMSMFRGCTALATAPALSATKLWNFCYYEMFYGCTALEVNATAPGKEWKIPATSTSASNWGAHMLRVRVARCRTGLR